MKWKKSKSRTTPPPEKRTTSPPRNNAADAQSPGPLSLMTRNSRRLTTSNLAQEELQPFSTCRQRRATRASKSLKHKYKQFPARVEAIKKYAAADAQFKQFKGTLDDVEDPQAHAARVRRARVPHPRRRAQGRASNPEAQAMIARLKGQRPRTQCRRHDALVCRRQPDEFRVTPSIRPIRIKPRNTRWPISPMASRWSICAPPIPGRWSRLDPIRSQHRPCRTLQLRCPGAKLFSELTRNNKNSPLAIVLDERMISAPNINSEIGAHGIITGGGVTAASIQGTEVPHQHARRRFPPRDARR